MLIVREAHRVVGAAEHDFEAAFRDRWLPELAGGGDARLLAYLHLAHGTGRAYEVVTLTAVRDGAAYERLVDRVRDGDLRSWAADVDRVRHDVDATILVTVPWAPPLVADLSDVPTTVAAQPLTVFREDTARPHAGKVDAYLDAARDHYAPSLAEGRHGGRAMLTLETVWQTAWGSGPRRAVVLWQRVRDPASLGRLIGSEIPAEHRAPGTWMHDALAVRDDWQSRLLRTASWSPLH
ncbi:MAG: hypothetical protein ACXW1M_04550 [Acidimicrobiia bacterium]